MILKGQKKQIEIKVNVEAEGDCGATIKDRLIVQVKTYSQSERVKLLDGLEGMNGVDFIREHLVKWREFKDSEGKEVEFSEENLDAVLEVSPYFDAILDSVKEGVFGRRVSAKLKNS